MRYTRYALLLFGAGMLLGLVVVAAKLPYLARVSSGAMAAGIVLLPIAVIADLRRRAPRPRPKAKAKPKAKTKTRTPAKSPRRSNAAAPARPRRPRAKR
jgi:hypothetical protein